MRRFAFFALVLSFGCGGGDAPPAAEPAPAAEATQGDEAPPPPPPREDGLAVEGILGTISERAVQRTMEGRQGRYLRCFGERYEANELLAGTFVLSFRIKTDGSVRWVYLAESDVGDRETERCLLRVAEGTRFSRPQGGEAEFRHSMSVDPLEREPVAWTADRAAATIAENREAIDACAAAGVRITAYVAPGGTVTTAGAALDDQEQPEGIDCVLGLVASWTFPDPGSYPAKVSFSL
ncbi:MAG: AgmX/PglI C-terminal domain-containing protein [Myxococcota bacterium]